MPKKLRENLNDDKNYQKCLLKNNDCKGRIEFHHHFQYAGKQIQEKWAIVALCHYHHSIVRNKEIANRVAWVALNRLLYNKELLEKAKKKYPKAILRWKQQVLFLNKKYGRYAR